MESHSHHAMVLIWKVLLLKGDGERGEERREEGGFFFFFLKGTLHRMVLSGHWEGQGQA